MKTKHSIQERKSMNYNVGVTIHVYTAFIILIKIQILMTRSLGPKHSYRITRLTFGNYSKQFW